MSVLMNGRLVAGPGALGSALGYCEDEWSRSAWAARGLMDDPEDIVRDLPDGAIPKGTGATLIIGGCIRVVDETALDLRYVGEPRTGWLIEENEGRRRCGGEYESFEDDGARRSGARICGGARFPVRYSPASGVCGDVGFAALYDAA
ncbi:hypothetical protein K503DRAFT_365092 [Rhizopogon vinicolor AM-OR11-026]|uniref:Uncharacterized protein n=1 Tax=Rhizopogon vinicolor AM-OR11-026 TaxID=1314800 RepID=A0A1B7MSI9_9AGAM|nr:hypothetical protein K503DRAFT_365092 [Rhizopogon vinicolor AM-OR11-026]